MPSWRITCFFLCNEAGETWIRAEELHWLLLAQILSAQKHRCWNNCWCYSRSGWQMDSRGSLANQSQNSGCTWTIRRCSWDMQQLFTDLTLQKIQNFRITVSDATQYPSYSFYLISMLYWTSVSMRPLKNAKTVSNNSEWLIWFSHRQFWTW